ncbi:MAG: hypothetical protein ABSC08_04145 [Bryobacteraceae bacterium]|jgi:hypothetical protein
MLLNYARSDETATPPVKRNLAPVARRVATVGVASVVAGALLFAAVHQRVSSGRSDGFGGRNLRFGPKADWRIAPLQRDRIHP